MSCGELQAEEREVLLSIYDGDSRFKDISPTTYQYKFGEENDPRSFLLEISWPENYPTEQPLFNMNTFYNKHLTDEVKEHVVKELEKECVTYLGEAMTYTIFELVKERENDLTEAQPEGPVPTACEEKDDRPQVEQAKKAEKKEQLSKSQKRRQWDRSDHKGEKPRGWDWVDLVKHLSQTGSKPDTESTT